MSVVPEEWSDPGSLSGTLYELAWIGLAIVVLGVVGYWQGWFGEAAIADGFAAVVVGPALAVATGYLFLFDERVWAFWSGLGRRFVALFVLIMAGQGLLSIVPVVTSLTMVLISPLCFRFRYTCTSVPGSTPRRLGIERREACRRKPNSDTRGDRNRARNARTIPGRRLSVL
jgi:hypothetical protein